MWEFNQQHNSFEDWVSSNVGFISVGQFSEELGSLITL